MREELGRTSDNLHQPLNCTVGCSQLGPGVTGERPLGIRPKVGVALISASGQGAWSWQLWERMLSWAGWGPLRFRRFRGMTPGWSSLKAHCCWWREAHPTALEGPEVLIALQEFWIPDTDEDSSRLSPSSTAETGCRGLEPGSPRVSAQDEPAGPCRCPQAGSGALEFGPRCVCPQAGHPSLGFSIPSLDGWGALKGQGPLGLAWEEGSLTPVPYHPRGPPALGHGAHVLGGRSGGWG